MATIVIEEDGELPRCPMCGYFAKDMDRHQRTEACKKGRARKINERRQEKQEKSDGVNIYINGKQTTNQTKPNTIQHNKQTNKQQRETSTTTKTTTNNNN